MTCGRLQLAFFFYLITECFQGPSMLRQVVSTLHDLFYGWIRCCMDASRFVHLLLDGRVGSFPVLAVMHNAALTAWQASLCGQSFASLFGCTPRCGIEGSDGHSVFTFFEDPPDVF